MNSTPDRNISTKLDELEHQNNRFMKNKQLAIEMQRSSQVRDATLKIIRQQTSQTAAMLMPKRIMSSAGKKNSKKEKKIEDKAVVKVPKDRSALIGVKRTRKSRDQIYQLQRMYE